MAKDHGPSVKDDGLYETLRERGAIKEKAARIANSKARGDDPSRKGGLSPRYEDWSKHELYEQARDLGVACRSRMRKDDLIEALRNR